MFAGQGAEPDQPIDFGKLKIVLFPDTASESGRYAVGWTIRPRGKETKPVDWSLLTSTEAAEAFQNRYPWDEDSAKKPLYELDDFLVDLKNHSALEFSGSWEPSRHPQVKWSSEINGRLYALLNKDHHFGTRDLWLIVIDHAGMHTINILYRTDNAIDQFLQKLRPADFEKFFATYYSLQTFDEKHVSISFEADDLKDTAGDSEIDGTVTISLPDGQIQKVWSDAKVDDPFKNDPDLSRADQDLNQIYSTLRSKLNSADREELKKEQGKWIGQRNENAKYDTDQALEQNESNDYISLRNKSLLQSTKERISQLRRRLAGYPYSANHD
jgi:uncharacterized protein YecT (DUF1311 family)